VNAPLVPATLRFDDSGTPYSERYRDVYHSATSATGQTRHVFLGGNDLPARWTAATSFCIVECGFGLGINFLTTWSAWRADPRRSRRLHFVSIEQHPFRAADLETAHARHSELASYAAALRAAWPVLVPGVHRMHFDDGAVTLTLVFADVADALRSFRGEADAFFMDGFAPERNPRMWTPRIAKGLSRLAKPGATLATWSVARSVRDALAAAGFAVERRPGYGSKRDMLVGHYEPRGRAFARSSRALVDDRRALVIGAGLAGSAVAERLTARGWLVEVVESAGAPAAAASGVRVAVSQPHVSRDDCLLSRWTRAGFLYAQSQWRTPAEVGHVPAWRSCGVLQLADGAANDARITDTAAQLGYPDEFARHVTRDSACELAGARVDVGGWWFERAGWLDPRELVSLQLARAHSRLGLLLDREVATLERGGREWIVRDAKGSTIARAPVVVMANAGDAVRLAAPGIDAAAYPWRRVRGQQSYVPAPPFVAPRIVVGGDGYVLPAHEGVAAIGATYDLDRDDTEVDIASHAQNLERAARMLPGSTGALDPSAIGGSVGVRCVARDRMPMVGAMVDVASARERAVMLKGARLSDLPRLPGLYGAFAFASRGATWALLAAELLASQIDGEPLPVESALADAVDPGRFVIGQLRHGTLTSGDRARC